MKSMKQLLRQPIKTLVGVVLIVVAVAELCLCVNQSAAAEKIQKRLNEIFMCTALPTADYTREADVWTLDYAAEHPEVVTSVGRPGLIAAYIPELTPDNYISAPIYCVKYHDLVFNAGREYDSAMFEITLTEVGEPSATQIYIANGNYKEIEEEKAGVRVDIRGNIERIVGLAAGYPDYQGFILSGSIYMPSMEEMKALKLTQGERYLVYGIKLSDADLQLRHNLRENVPELNGTLPESFDMSRMIIDYESMETVRASGTSYPVAAYPFDGYWYSFPYWEFDMVQTVFLDLADESSEPNLIWEIDGEGNPYVVVLDHQSYMGKDGQPITVTPEEYHERYAEPVIAHLEGTVEEFLASEEGAIWKEALYNIEINSHAFPMIGVDSLFDIADFVQGKADIAQGRSFTQEELDSGAKVCLLSQTVAEMNGLAVGDTLTLQVYENDPGVPYQVNIAEGEGSLKPVAYYYFDNTMDMEAAEEYTVIGLYRQDQEWTLPDSNLYAFSPNTLFVPKSSVSAQMDESYMAFFRSFVLNSEAVEEFRAAAKEAGFGHMFFHSDNGYSAAAGSLAVYRESAGRALFIGCCIYVIAMLLFLLLFPIQQKAAAATMGALGASRGKQVRHIVLSSAGILLPGTLLGAVIGIFLWGPMADYLTQESSVALGIELSVVGMMAAATVQLIAALILCSLAAFVMTREKSLMSRK